MLYDGIAYLSLVFSWYTHSPKKAGGYILEKSTSCSWDIARYTIRKLYNFFDQSFTAFYFILDCTFLYSALNAAELVFSSVW